MKINLAMIVKNESRCIEKCLRAALPLVDDVIVVDTGSTDGTIGIIQAFSERICLYHFDWVDDFSAARNYSLEKSEEHGADYTLVLDADEYLRRPRGLGRGADGRDYIHQFLERSYASHGRDWAGYLIRYNCYRGSEGEIDTAEDRITRLLPRGVRYEGSIHEQPQAGGVRLVSPFVADHDGYLDQGKGERNLAYLKRELLRDPEDPYILYQMGAALKSMKQTGRAAYFFSRFYEKVEGKDQAFCADYVRDGVIRYLYALLDLGDGGSLERAHSIIGDIEKYYLRNSDYYFLRGIFFMKLVLYDTSKYIGYLDEIEKSYLRCIEIGEESGEMTVVGTGSFKAWHNLGLYYRLSGDGERAAWAALMEEKDREKYS